jgi:undecaprenyl-diphosphatase
MLILAVVQGLTEFLPISSSGHLVLTGKVMCWEDQGLAIDVAVHVGTLFAVALYFWRDIWMMTIGLGRLVTGRGGPQAKVLISVVVGTIPVVIVGFLAKDYVALVLRDVEIIAWTTIGFGILLWVADRVGMTVWRVEHLGVSSALLIGLSQVLALIPGTSRSGITMTSARLLGLERAEAARFSMLLSIPTILGAGLLTGLDIYEEGNMALGADVILAAAMSFVAGLVAIALMMRWLRHAGFGPFVIYRLLLGGLLLYWVYGLGLSESASPFCG